MWLWLEGLPDRVEIGIPACTQQPIPARTVFYSPGAGTHTDIYIDMPEPATRHSTYGLGG